MWLLRLDSNQQPSGNSCGALICTGVVPNELPSSERAQIRDTRLPGFVPNQTNRP
jgi:hypothetical protein